MDVSQQMIIAPKNCTGIVDYEQIGSVLVGNAKVAYLTVNIVCAVATVLSTLQFVFIVFWNWKASQKQPDRARELVTFIMYITVIISAYYVDVQRKLGHITPANYLFSLAPRSILSIFLPMCFIKPILSVPKHERPYRRVGVIPAVFATLTLTFSSFVVVLDRGVTYGENRTLAKLELTQALVLFVLSTRLRRVPLEGCWPILRRSLFLVWLPPFQRLFIHSLPLSMPQWLFNGNCSPVTVSEVKDSLFGALVVFEALVFSTSLFVFLIRNKSVVNDTEAAEPMEQATNPSEQEKVELPGNVIESENKPAQANSEGTDASLN